MVMLGGILNCERDLQRENPKYEIFVSRGEGRVGTFTSSTKGGETTYLNERKKRFPARPLEILPGLEHDLVGPRLEHVVGVRGRKEV